MKSLRVRILFLNWIVNWNHQLQFDVINSVLSFKLQKNRILIHSCYSFCHSSYLLNVNQTIIALHLGFVHIHSWECFFTSGDRWTHRFENSNASNCDICDTPTKIVFSLPDSKSRAWYSFRYHLVDTDNISINDNVYARSHEEMKLLQGADD